MARINIPGVGLVDFPDTMTDAEIAEAIDRDILKNVAPETSLVSSVKDAIFERSLGEKGLLKSSQQKNDSLMSQAVAGVPYRKDYIEKLSQQDRINPNVIDGMADESRAAQAVIKKRPLNAEFNQTLNDDIYGAPKAEASFKEKRRLKDLAKAEIFLGKKQSAEDGGTSSTALQQAVNYAPSEDEIIAKADEIAYRESHYLAPNARNIVAGIAASPRQGIEATKQGIRAQFADLIDHKSMSADAQDKAQSNREDIASTTPTFETSTAQGLYSGATSLIQQIPGLAASIATGNPAPALISAGLTTEAEAYTRYKGRGASSKEALIGALGEGSVEVLTELTPMRFLVDKFGKVGAGKFIAGFVAKDVLPEEAATLAQDAIDTAIANPNKTWGDYLAERPGAAYQTLLATVVQAGVMGGGSSIARGLTQTDDLTTQKADKIKAIAAKNADTFEQTYQHNKAAHEATAALEGINEAATVDDAITLATETIKTPLTTQPRADLLDDSALLDEINQYTNDTPLTSDLLGTENVGNSEQGNTALLDSIPDGSGNVDGSGSTTLAIPTAVAAELSASDIASESPIGARDVGSVPVGTNAIEGAGNAPLIADSKIPAEAETSTAAPVAAAKKPSQMTLDEFKQHKKVVNQGVFGNDSPFDDAEIALQHLDYIETALTAKQPVANNALAQHSDADLTDYPRIKKALLAQQKSTITPILEPTAKAEIDSPINGIKATPLKTKKPAKQTATLLATLRNIGGVTMGDKLDVTGQDRAFAPGGYNQIFTNKSQQSLKGHIENGELDEYLPYNLRLTAGINDDQAYDSTEAYDYLSDRIRNGERVLPYEAEQEIVANKYAQEQELNAQDAADELAFELLEEEINEQLRTASNEEREVNANSREFIPDSADSLAASGERAPSGNEAGIGQTLQPSTITASPVQSAPSTEREGVRPLVEAIVKRRAAATQIGKIKQFDAALVLAKQLMNGETVKPSSFKLAASTFKADPPLSSAFTALHELANTPAKTARAEVKSTLADYQTAIAGAKTVEELQAIARNIQQDTTLSDKQATDLDDAVFEAQDKLESAGVEVNKSEFDFYQFQLEDLERKIQETQDSIDNKTYSISLGLSGSKFRLATLKEKFEQAKQSPSDTFGNPDDVITYTGRENKKFTISKYNHVKLQYLTSVVYDAAKKISSDAASEFSTMSSSGYVNVLDIKIRISDHPLPKEFEVKYGKPDLEIKDLSDIDKALKFLNDIKNRNAANVSADGMNAKANFNSVANSDKSDAKTSGADNNLPQKNKNANTDLLGQDSAKQQAIADAERTKDAKRNTGDANASDFNLTGSNSEADKAIAAGAQDLFAQPAKDEVAKATQALDAAGITGTEKLTTIAQVRQGNLTADEVASAHKIEDFGDKIGGAKKDTYTRKLEESKNIDVSAEPLSKSWPEPDYQELLDSGTDPFVVGFVRAVRESIPRKPTRAYRADGWVKSVTQLRDMAYGLLDGSISADKTVSVLTSASKNSHNMSGVIDRIDLYMRVGHSKSLKGVRISFGEYSIRDGVEYKPSLKLWTVDKQQEATAFSSWPKGLATGKTRQEAIDNFAAKYDSLDIQDAPKAKETTFDIYAYPKNVGKTGWFIGKKLGRKHVDLENFATVKEAREYKRDHHAELVAKLEKIKEIPSVRPDSNKPRVGEDMRNGQDVTPELFAETFAFKGVEFGNWVEGSKRQKDLNESFDALMDMAAILDIPPKAISLNGELGLAFGARGTGGIDPAKAHYEAGHIVINLTKKDGAGSLGHEWWHSLDNYFSRMRNKPSDFMTAPVLDVSLAARGSAYHHSGAVRKEMVDAFGEVVKAINGTALKARSSKLDAKRSSEYWTTGLEMSARSFETYLIAKLQDQNASNDYLANIIDEKTWAVAEDLGFELGTSYPYPTAAEIPAIRGAFDHFFSVIETKETEQGTALFSRSESAIIDNSNNEVNDETTQAIRSLENAARKDIDDRISLSKSLPIHQLARAGGSRSEGQARAFELAGKLANIFESKIVTFDNNTPEIFDFNGVQYGSTIYLNAKANRPAHVVFGHEFLHELRKNDKAAYAKLIQVIEPMITDLEGFRSAEGIEKFRSADYVKEELAANLVGNRFNEVSFWRKLALKMPKHFKAVVDVIANLIGKIQTAFTGNQKLAGDEFITDVAKAREAIVDAVAMYKKLRGDKAYSPLFSRDIAPSDTKLFKELTINDDMFKYGKSESKDLQQVFDEVVPELVKVEKSNINDDDIQDFYNIYPVDNNGNVKRNQPGQIMVYKDGKVELNVLQWDEGFGGSGVYAAVGNWAYNNGKVFAGDREGITPTGKLRRLENMISLALKFGTTDHIAPHPDQMSDLGFDWKEGDFEYNVGQMLEASYNAIRNGVYVTESNHGVKNTFKSPDAEGVAKLDDIVYDFDKQQFIELSSGKPYTDEKFGLLAQSRQARAVVAGRTTLKRAAIAHTFVREQGQGRKRLLERISKLALQSLEGTQLKGIFYSRSNQQDTLQAQDDIPAETNAQAIQRIGQDKFNRFKVLQDFVTDNGVDLTESADVYLAETLMSGRIASRKEDFRDGQVEPLIKKTQAADLTMEQIGDFLKVQHAPEANKRARELQGQADATAYGVSDTDAQAAMDDFKALPNFAELKKIANEWRAITEQTKQIKLQSGLLTDEMVQAWQDTYDVYVPVKGTDEAGLSNGTGQGLNVKVRNKQRLGHGLRDEAIIENILRDHEAAISLDEENIVGKALIKFALEAQNDDIITIDKPVKRKVLKQGESAFVVAYQGADTATFDTRKEADLYIQAQVAFGKTKSNFSVDQTKDPVRVMLQASPQLADNEVTVYVRGHAVRLQINDDVAAREYKNMGVEHLNTILSAGREVNNWLSKAYTGYSPDFIFTNPIRDAIQGMITLTGNLGGATAAKIYTNYPVAVKELVKHFKNKGTSALVTEYRMMGGSTGGAYLSDLERIGNDIQASYNEYQGSLATYKSTYDKAIAAGKSKKTAHTLASLKAGAAGFKKIPVIGHFLKLMENINAITENALRVATYKTLSENGMSKAKAAAQAKNLMNFNRRGEQSNAAGALYLFFNPAVQGSKLIQEALLTSPHKRQAQALTGGMVLTAFTLAMMALNGDDEDKDKWNKTPDYIKDGNIVFDMFGTQFTLTLPYGYRVFWTLGNVMADASQGKDTGKLGNRMASSLFQNFSPIGSPLKENGSKLDLNTFQIFPTAAKMLGAPTKGEQGEDGFGRPITPKKWNNATPDSQLMNRGTHGSLYDGVAEKLNELSGGSKYKAGMADVSPETLKFWVKSLTGGAGQFAFDTINITKQAAQGVPPQDVRDIPIVRKFVREPGVRDSRAEFWNRKNEADLAADEIGLARKAHDREALMDLRQRNGVLAGMAKLSDRAIKMANAKRNAVAKIHLDDTLTLSEKIDLIQELEVAEQKVYDKFIDAFDLKTK